ncbi:MAG: ribonuclease III [Oligoflexia bacterium]|nr:ribonuclease III [Oligoflexia bacterium]
MFTELEEKLGYEFKDKEVLRLALRHKSHANESKKKSTSKEEFVQLHNERLEFLGDSVLGLVISDELYENYKQVNEGALSKMRSSLVKEETLAAVARDMELGNFLLLGKGEKGSKGANKDSILASSYEAILGAIYLDGGLSAAQQTIRKHFDKLMNSAFEKSQEHDRKTLLQEVCQSKFRKSPVYRVVAEEGPDHDKRFEVVVSVGNLERYGKGRNKKDAEQNAAKFLLDSLNEAKVKELHEKE